MFNAWYWSLLRYIQILEPVAIHSKLGTGACCDTVKAWYFAISFKIGIKNVVTRFKLGIEPVAICFKLGIATCFKLGIKPVAICFKLGIEALIHFNPLLFPQ